MTATYRLVTANFEALEFDADGDPTAIETARVALMTWPAAVLNPGDTYPTAYGTLRRLENDDPDGWDVWQFVCALAEEAHS